MKIENLVFEGGGVKGIAYGGAYKALQERNLVKDVDSVAGTSAGAITATLVACGADADTLLKIISSTNFRSFMDDSFGQIRDINRLINNFGWYKGEAFEKWMREQIKYLTGRKRLSFGDLIDKTGIGLYVVGTNLSKKVPIVFSHEDYASMQVWKAVRVSMSIPLFFQAIKDKGSVMVDGGLSWNFPIDIFDHPNVVNMNTLGLKLVEPKQKQLRHQKEEHNIKNFIDFVSGCISYTLDIANSLHVKEADKLRTIFIPSCGIKATDFNLTPDQIQTLIRSGYESAMNFNVYRP